MLKDSEIVQLKKSDEYKNITQLGLKKIASDLIRSGDGDLKPEVSTLLKVTYYFFKSRIIRQELYISSKNFLERILNCDLKIPRLPDMARPICEDNSENYLWMRFDEPRVNALFNRSINLITDAAFRDVLKRNCSIQRDKNERLEEILREIKDLQIITLRSIQTKGLFNGLVRLRADEFYRSNEKKITKKFLASSKEGSLGSLPDNIGDKNNER